MLEDSTNYRFRSQPTFSPITKMRGLNCSLAALLTARDTVFNGTGCPEAAMLCGMNISWILATAPEHDVLDLCKSEEEYLVMKQGAPRSPEFFPVCVTYLAIFMVGVLGNCLTCVAILRYKVMQTPTNYYLLSLAVSDLLVLLLGMPLEIYDLWQNYPFLFGEGGCYFKTFLFETVCFASILNVTALSVERYVAVVHPLRVKHMTTRAHVRRVIFLLWMLSMLCAVPNTSLHGIQELPPKYGRQFPRSAICGLVKPIWMYKLVILVSTLAFFLLPMLIISILYLLIGLQLRRERVLTAVDSGVSFGPESLTMSHQQKLNKRNVQITKMLCVLVIVFGICWAPFHVDRLVYSYIDNKSELHQKIFGHVHNVTGVFFYMSSAINPILYSLMSTRFREMFCHITCSSHASNSWSSHSSHSLQMTQRSSLNEKAAVQN